MPLDHLFIFSSHQGVEADELVQFGLKEGSSRIHTGQGTTNRKFYFENFFLEILWVHDEAEIQSEHTSVTNLWRRANFESNGCSPFGLCLLNTDETDSIFANAKHYQPAYFQEGMTVEFVDYPQLPWLFRLPFKGVKKPTNEPLDHTRQLKKLTKTIFQISNEKEIPAFVPKSFHNHIQFMPGEEHLVILEFDDFIQRQEHRFERLPIVVRY